MEASLCVAVKTGLLSVALSVAPSVPCAHSGIWVSPHTGAATFDLELNLDHAPSIERETPRAVAEVPAGTPRSGTKNATVPSPGMAGLGIAAGFFATRRPRRID